MYSYLVEDKVLFSCDSFGSHYCDEGMFDDEIHNEANFHEAFKYYFDVILKPFSKFMLKAIDKIKGLDISVIATGHGPILRKNWKKYVDLSKQYATKALEQPEKHRVFIPYVSAYHLTGMVAEMIADGIRASGDIEVDVCDIENATIGELEEKIIRASAYVVGSPTINQNILLPVYKLFALINPIRDKGKPAAAFGSYGWSGEARQMIKTNLENLKLKVFDDGIFVKFTPNEEAILKAYEFGKAFGTVVLSNNNQS
jgi:flavorubredoxin